jgi:hypothetical protein
MMLATKRPGVNFSRWTTRDSRSCKRVPLMLVSPHFTPRARSGKGR